MNLSHLLNRAHPSSSGTLRSLLDALEDSGQMTEGTSRRTKTIADTLTGLTRRG
ncbi:hypothetical protein [Pseudomonas sp. MWU12-2037]|uniref:hypothetical protein n=1 Tax=Pseudomonas sp. MWU12-2037 TaxID=2928690 RepID=UPI00200F6C66|nr:hypothetical protein [Pseudomonas sp. MWU12-2037]